MIFLFRCLTALLMLSLIIAESDRLRAIYNNVQLANGASIVFPEYRTPMKKKEIPLDLILRMNEVTDTEDFLQNFVYFEEDNATLTEISSRIELEGVERSAVTRAKMAVCQPELTTVSVKPIEDSTLYYHPSCIRVERCGGCCAHSLLTCTARDSEIIHVEVLVAEYKGGQRLVPKERKVIPVERHTKCGCDCRIQPEDCTKSQRYNKRACNCECNNPDAEKKCHADSENKIWNRERCACLCKEINECSTGFYFDPISCRCEVQEGRRKQNLRPWIA